MIIWKVSRLEKSKLPSKIKSCHASHYESKLTKHNPAKFYALLLKSLVVLTWSQSLLKKVFFFSWNFTSHMSVGSWKSLDILSPLLSWFSPWEHFVTSGKANTNIKKRQTRSTRSWLWRQPFPCYYTMVENQ